MKNGEDISAIYAQAIFQTSANLVTDVRFGKTEEVRQAFGQLLLNLAEMASDLGFREAKQLHEASDSFEFKRR